jgi:hypothetical protein
LQDKQNIQRFMKGKVGAGMGKVAMSKERVKRAIVETEAVGC